MNNNKISFEEESLNEEENIRVRKDWQKVKKIIFNKNFLLRFIAISILIIDLIIIDYFSPYLRDKISDNQKVASKIEEDANVLNKEGSKETDLTEEECNVKGINLHGDLITYIPYTDYSESGNLKEDEVTSEEIYFDIKSAEKNNAIKAILIEVDSAGGDPAAAEEINRVIKSSNKPIVTYIRAVGASASYWSITGSKRIFALKTSSVGSIGVTYSYVDNVKSNENEGLTFHDLSTGKFKSIMNRNKELTNEEKELIMNDLQKTHNLFVETVAENRKLDINKVKELANGWAYDGNDALKNGLIDEIGGLDEASSYLKNNILNGEEIKICW